MTNDKQVKSTETPESLTGKFKPEQGFVMPLGGRDLIIEGKLVPFTLTLEAK